MIINIRATNGAGKSYIVHKIMKQYDDITEIAYLPIRNKKRPMGYICRRGTRRLFIPGHYEIDNGGIDTLDSLRFAYELILEHHALGADVLYEGMNFSENLNFILDCHKVDLDIRVVFIRHPLSDCIKSVRKRGNAIKVETITALFEKSNKEFVKLRVNRVKCFALDRRESFCTINNWLTEEAHVLTAGAERLSSTVRNS